MSNTKNEEKALATKGEEQGNAVATIPTEAMSLFDLKDNMKGVIPRLPQIGIIHQGQLFKFPDGSKVGEFTGIILHKTYSNGYWAKSFDETGGGTPPTCASLDGISPDMNSEEPQSEKCANCPLNKYGSDGRGKSCKNMMRVHILLKDSPTPFRLTLPPSNLRAMEDYISDVSLRGIPFQLVYTKFTLLAEQNKDGIEYSEIVPTESGQITDIRTAQAVKNLMTQWMPAFTSEGLGADER